MIKLFSVFALSCAWAATLLLSGPQLEAQSRFTSARGVDDVAQPYSSSALPAEPAPAWSSANPADPGITRREDQFVLPGMEQQYGMLSRMSIGSSISPFGIGANGAVILNEHVDARVDTSWFFYNTGRMEVSGVNVNGDFHFASAAAKLDWYPTKSMWRLSPGMLFYNGNQASARIDLRGGTNFNINGTDYWSSTENAATGATPITGDVRIGLHTRTPAFTVSGGFGKFVPHSRRHWSFPTEFGVAFTGPPSLDVTLSGWACTDKKETQCTDIGDTTNPVGSAFQSNLNTALTKWRHELNSVQIYPIFSTAFMYSFNLPGSR